MVSTTFYEVCRSVLYIGFLAGVIIRNELAFQIMLLGTRTKK